MFTGLVADLGEVEAVEGGDDGARVRIRTTLARELREGDSVAVNGVCLTAVAPDAAGFGADVMAETLRRSSLRGVDAGRRVNLELALRASDRLGGHVVLGHVDGVAEVAQVREEGFARVVRVRTPAGLLRYVVEKGSIAVDGVSLTVSAVDDEAFEVSLIPETQARTTLGGLRAGDPVNLEVDVMAKHLEKLMEAHAR